MAWTTSGERSFVMGSRVGRASAFLPAMVQDCLDG